MEHSPPNSGSLRWYFTRLHRSMETGSKTFGKFIIQGVLNILVGSKNKRVDQVKEGIKYTQPISLHSFKQTYDHTNIRPITIQTTRTTFFIYTSTVI